MHSDDGSLDCCKYSLFGRQQLSPATVSNTVVADFGSTKKDPPKGGRFTRRLSMAHLAWEAGALDKQPRGKTACEIYPSL
jgi:hypothetical protein